MAIRTSRPHKVCYRHQSDNGYENHAENLCYQLDCLHYDLPIALLTISFRTSRQLNLICVVRQNQSSHIPRINALLAVLPKASAPQLQKSDRV